MFLPEQDNEQVVPVTETTEQVEEKKVEEQEQKPDNSALLSALQKEREERKRKESELRQLKTQLENLDKSEKERIKIALAEKERELQEVNLRNMKMAIALEKNIPHDLIDNLAGNDEYTIRQNAEILLKYINRQPVTKPMLGTTSSNPDNTIYVLTNQEKEDARSRGMSETDYFMYLVNKGKKKIPLK